MEVFQSPRSTLIEVDGDEHRKEEIQIGSIKPVM
jgi:hypothetical protein